ncbi:hypothetical protein RZS08_45470, partial [Arthrospira platensis SPKY1]|nr:hypothetical protein [Arthrospira platensis SPKY1]
MDAGDRRYFRKRARRNGFRDGENYLELFDLIDQAKSYDEDAICRQLSNPLFARNISASKHYLYHQLLDSLQEQHTGARDRVRPEMEAARYWSKLQ